MLFVERIIPENHTITSMVIRGDIDQAFKERRAGQFLSLQLPEGEGWSRPHPFTISNAPEDSFLQVTTKAVGPFSSTIPYILPNTEVHCRGPFGKFCTGIEERTKIVLVAGGIGITPFLSVIRHFVQSGFTGETTVLWANNKITDLFGEDELLNHTKRINLRVIHLIQSGIGGKQSNDAYSFEEGLITVDLFRKYNFHPDHSFYLCGSPGMQEYALRQLAAFGVHADHVEKESFHKP